MKYPYELNLVNHRKALNKAKPNSCEIEPIKVIDQLFYKLYGLTEAEIEIINKS